MSDTVLGPAGVEPFDEVVYKMLLGRSAATPVEPGDVAVELDCTNDRAARALDRLRGHGLVSRLAGRRRRYSVVEPQAAVEALVRHRESALQAVRAAGTEFSALLAAATFDSTQAVRVVRGTDALARWFVTLQQEARDEVLGVDRPPYALSSSNPVEERGLARGVRFRGIYAPESLEWPGGLDSVAELVGRGEQARVLAGASVKLAIADRRRAVMPLSLELDAPGASTELRTLVVGPSTLLDALVELFEVWWRLAVPLGPADGGRTVTAVARGTGEAAAASTGPADEGRRLLTLMAAGLKDEAIARQLGWSTRTMRRRMSGLLAELGAANRFQAGLLARERGWL